LKTLIRLIETVVGLDSLLMLLLLLAYLLFESFIYQDDVEVLLLVGGQLVFIFRYLDLGLVQVLLQHMLLLLQGLDLHVGLV
jgi:predicted benzoate:H+ symporter BenE